MDDDKKELRARAFALREAGRTRDQIRRELGLTSGWAVNELLDREPARHPGLRARAKDDLRQRARELRDQGKTYPEIAAELGVSKSSVSLWVRDLPSPTATPEGKARSQERRTSAVRAAWDRKHAEVEIERRQTRDLARRQIGQLAERDVLLAGALAYWCEGEKAKPWRKVERVQFINSDPGLILLFLRFLAVATVERERVRLRVHIHERADVPAAEAYWSDLTGFPATSFYRSTLKKHNPKTVRKNVNDDYNGCLVVTVLQSAELYRKIEGWAQGAMGVAIVETD